MTKDYTIKQAAELCGINHRALSKQIERDANKDVKQRKYPNAYKAECCGTWMIPAKDLKLSE
jgi:hypothetical protein